MDIDDPLYHLKFKRGSDLPQSKLTEEDVLNILDKVELREELKQTLYGMTNVAIAKEYGVAPSTINKLVKGGSWSHV